MSAVVSVRNLTKTFGAVTAVDDLSFTIGEGEIFGLLGPNGAGKTTTIQMLLGVIGPDGGDIFILGKSLAQERESVLAQCNFSSSYLSLPYNLTVMENLRIFGRLYGLTNIDDRIEKLLSFFDIADWRKTPVGKLSSGQLTRLLLAKALLNRPRFLLLDEPTASLDPDIADRIRRMLKDLVREEKLTILYTSHNMAEVEHMCDRIVFMHHGKKIADGIPTEVIKQHGRKNLEDLFIHFSRSQEEKA